MIKVPPTLIQYAKDHNCEIRYGALREVSCGNFKVTISTEDDKIFVLAFYMQDKQIHSFSMRYPNWVATMEREAYIGNVAVNCLSLMVQTVQEYHKVRRELEGAWLVSHMGV
ncbi:MAG: hypothetical protein HF312_15630 [Ignavibacteria bacterium]|jgi:hypothetical protein|nr:hypothetical protein [Ignavibacteria bacterium]